MNTDPPLLLWLRAVGRNDVAIAGGKGANLGEMTSAGLPVPPGFCITTAAYELVAAEAGLDALLDAHAARQARNAEELAQMARACMLKASMPEGVADAIAHAYRVLGAGEPIPVAVRSSATAEDLPFASFAGQQDTDLNVVVWNLLPGQVTDSHKHPENAHTFLVITGEGEYVRESDPAVAIRAGDMVVIPRETVHVIRNTGSAPLSYVAVSSIGPHGYYRVSA